MLIFGSCCNLFTDDSRNKISVLKLFNLSCLSVPIKEYIQAMNISVKSAKLKSLSKVPLTDISET